MTSSLTPFISRGDLSDHIGRDVTTDDGALAACDAACDIVRNITEQDWNAVTKGTVFLDGTGTDALILPQRPVSHVTSVTVGGTVTSGTATGGTAVTSWMVRDDGCLLKTAGATTGDAAPTYWPKGRQNIKVVYNHGYGTAVLPRDVRMVALQLASRILIQGVSIYETVGDVSVRYAGPPLDLSSGERAILDRYRR